MLVNARHSPVIQPTNRSDMDPTTAANNALASGFVQHAQAAAGLSAAPATQNAADKVADNVNAAFAKTRVHLQAKVPDVAAAATLTATPPTTRTAPSATVNNDSDAMKAFKDYMSKPPAQRLREQLLKEQGLSEADVKAMPADKQDAINKQIAERIKETFHAQAAKNSPNSTDQAAASVLATK